MKRAVIAWGVVVLSALFLGAGAILGNLNGETFEEFALTFGLATFSAGISFSVLGALITTRRPENVLGPIFLVIGVTQALNATSTPYAMYALGTAPGSIPFGRFFGWLALWSWAPGFGLLTTLSVLLFPDGALPSRRWRWTIPVIGVALGLLIVPMAVAGATFGEDKLLTLLTSDETVPGTIEAAYVLQLAGVFLALTMMLVSIAGVVVRFRRSRGDERQQLKWFAFSAVVTMGFLTFMVVAAGRVDNPIVVGVLAVLPFVAGLPTGVATAIFKYRLYDIDVVINRTLVYTLLTAVLGAVYGSLVVGFQAALQPFTAQSDLAIAGSTLAVAALFRPARTRIQAFIDRRFYRRKVDAHETLERFSDELRDEVELGALTSRLVGVVAETMQPAHVSLWLREGARV